MKRIFALCLLLLSFVVWAEVVTGVTDLQSITQNRKKIDLLTNHK